jgi:hypothetical protein
MKKTLLAILVLFVLAIPGRGDDDDPLGIIGGMARALQIVDPVEKAYLVETFRNTELDHALKTAVKGHRRTLMYEHYFYSRGSRATPRLIRMASQARDDKGTVWIYRSLSTKAPADEAVVEILALDDPDNVHAVFSWHFEYDPKTRKWRHVVSDDVREKTGRP